MLTSASAVFGSHTGNQSRIWYLSSVAPYVTNLTATSSCYPHNTQMRMHSPTFTKHARTVGAYRTALQSRLVDLALVGTAPRAGTESGLLMLQWHQRSPGPPHRAGYAAGGSRPQWAD